MITYGFYSWFLQSVYIIAIVVKFTSLLGAVTYYRLVIYSFIEQSKSLSYILYETANDKEGSDLLFYKSCQHMRRH